MDKTTLDGIKNTLQSALQADVDFVYHKIDPLIRNATLQERSEMVHFVLDHGESATSGVIHSALRHAAGITLRQLPASRATNFEKERDDRRYIRETYLEELIARDLLKLRQLPDGEALLQRTSDLLHKKLASERKTPSMAAVDMKLPNLYAEAMFPNGPDDRPKNPKGHGR